MKRIIPFLFLFSLIILSFCFLNWPALKWSSIELRGLNFTSSQDIKTYCNGYKGKNIIFLNYSGLLKHNLLKRFPTLDKITLKWSYPGKLSLIFKEKTPYYSFIIPGKSVLVSQDGTILNKESGNTEIANFDGVVIIRGLTQSSFASSEVNPFIISKMQIIVSEIRAHLPSMVFQLEFQKMTYVDTEDIGNLTLLKDDSLPIKVGAIEKLSEKFRVLHYYFKGNLHDNREINYIDLRVPNRVIVNYAQT